MGRTHALTGVALALPVVPALRLVGIEPTPVTVPLLVAAAAGGGVFPDFDHPSATIAHALGPVTKGLARAVSSMFGGHRNGTHSWWGTVVFTAATAGLLCLGPVVAGLWCGFLFSVGMAALRLRLSKASIVFHTLLCLVGGLALASLADSYALTWTSIVVVSVGFAVGYLSHWGVADALTKEGVVPWWPLNKKRFHLASFTTGQFFERVVFFNLMLLVVALELGWIVSGQASATVLPDPAKLWSAVSTWASHLKI